MMPPMPTGIVLEYAVTDDRAIIGIGDVFVRLALPSRGRFPGVAAALLRCDPALGAATRRRRLVDLAGTREAIESALGPCWRTGVWTRVESEIRPWLLPLDAWWASRGSRATCCSNGQRHRQ